jgi:hypothetical protein
VVGGANINVVVMNPRYKPVSEHYQMPNLNLLLKIGCDLLPNLLNTKNLMTRLDRHCATKIIAGCIDGFKILAYRC